MFLSAFYRTRYFLGWFCYKIFWQDYYFNLKDIHTEYQKGKNLAKFGAQFRYVKQTEKSNLAQIIDVNFLGEPIKKFLSQYIPQGTTQGQPKSIIESGQEVTSFENQQDNIDSSIEVNPQEENPIVIQENQTVANLEDEQTNIDPDIEIIQQSEAPAVTEENQTATTLEISQDNNRDNSSNNQPITNNISNIQEAPVLEPLSETHSIPQYAGKDPVVEILIRKKELEILKTIEKNDCTEQDVKNLIEKYEDFFDITLQTKPFLNTTRNFFNHAAIEENMHFVNLLQMVIQDNKYSKYANKLKNLIQNEISNDFLSIHKFIAKYNKNLIHNGQPVNNFFYEYVISKNLLNSKNLKVILNYCLETGNQDLFNRLARKKLNLLKEIILNDYAYYKKLRELNEKLPSTLKKIPLITKNKILNIKLDNLKLNEYIDLIKSIKLAHPEIDINQLTDRQNKKLNNVFYNLNSNQLSEAKEIIESGLNYTEKANNKFCLINSIIGKITNPYLVNAENKTEYVDFLKFFVKSYLNRPGELDKIFNIINLNLNRHIANFNGENVKKIIKTFVIIKNKILKEQKENQEVQTNFKLEIDDTNTDLLRNIKLNEENIKNFYSTELSNNERSAIANSLSVIIPNLRKLEKDSVLIDYGHFKKAIEFMENSLVQDHFLTLSFITSKETGEYIIPEEIVVNISSFVTGLENNDKKVQGNNDKKVQENNGKKVQNIISNMKENIRNIEEEKRSSLSR